MNAILGKISVSPRQSGASVITAIFLLLLMAGLALLMVNLTSTANSDLATDVAGTRAYQAARAGVEWSLYQLDPNAQSASLPTCAGASGSLSTIPGHSVVVSCTPYPSDSAVYTEGSRSLRIFRIVATATPTAAKTPGIEREIAVTVEKCRDTLVSGAPYDC